MSFKVGDKVVILTMHLDNKFVHVVSKVLEDLVEVCGSYVYSSELRHATPAEIAVGHRIDHCVEATKKVELFGNSEGLEVLEMVDVSPNCEVIEQ